MKGCPTCGEQFAREMMPADVVVDTVLMKLSDAKPGDVLVIRCDDRGEAYRLMQMLEQIRLPAGSLPKGGVPVVLATPDVEWALEKVKT